MTTTIITTDSTTDSSTTTTTTTTTATTTSTKTTTTTTTTTTTSSTSTKTTTTSREIIAPIGLTSQPRRSTTTDNTGFDSLKQNLFTNNAAEWIVRSVLVGVVLLVIVVPVGLILHLISRRNTNDEAALITPTQPIPTDAALITLPTDAAIPTDADAPGPEQKEFVLSRRDSFSLHIWLAERSFHGFESELKRIGVVMVPDLACVSDEQLYSMGMDRTLVARFKTEVGAYYTKHPFETGKMSHPTENISQHSPQSAYPRPEEWQHLVNSLPSRRRSSHGEARALPGLITRERYSWGSSDRVVKKQRACTDPNAGLFRMPGFESPRPSYCSSRDRSRSAGSFSSASTSIGRRRSTISGKGSGDSSDTVFPSMFFPGTRSKATTTVIAPVSPGRKAHSPFNRLRPFTFAVSAPQSSIGRTRRSSKTVAYATISNTNPRVPSPRASPRSRVSSVESVQLVDGRPLGETNPMGLHTSVRLNNPPVTHGLTININSSARSNPQSNTPSPNRRFFRSGSDPQGES